MELPPLELLLVLWCRETLLQSAFPVSPLLASDAGTHSVALQEFLRLYEVPVVVLCQSFISWCIFPFFVIVVGITVDPEDPIVRC